MEYEPEAVGRMAAWSGVKNRSIMFPYQGEDTVGDCRICVESGLKSLMCEQLSADLTHEVQYIQSCVPLWMWSEMREREEVLEQSQQKKKAPKGKAGDAKDKDKGKEKETSQSQRGRKKKEPSPEEEHDDDRAPPEPVHPDDDDEIEETTPKDVLRALGKKSVSESAPKPPTKAESSGRLVAKDSDVEVRSAGASSASTEDRGKKKRTRSPEPTEELREKITSSQCSA